MSHFTVLVPANDEEHLERVLLPFHEYECTGIEEYLEWVDETDELEQEYKVTLKEFVKMPDGSIRDKYDQEFWHRLGTTAETRPMATEREKFVLPDDAEIVETTREDAGLETFLEFIDDWGGAEEIPGSPGRYGRKTNPNAKWDWWQIGGRWTGLLKLKPTRNGYVECPYCGHEQKPKDLAACEKCGGPLDVSQFISKEAIQTETGSGSPGLMTEPNTKDGYCDYAPAGFVNWDGISQSQLEDIMRTYNLYHECIDTTLEPFNTEDDQWKTVSSAAKKTYTEREYCQKAFATEEDYVIHSLADKLLYREHKISLWNTFQEHADRFYKSAEEYRDMFSSNALTYAFIDLDGNWNQRGEMGWFGMDDESKGTQNYDQTFWNFVHSLPSEQRVYVIDCHI